MTMPYFTHSGMTGAPQLSTAARTVADVLAAVLVNGFNTQAPTSATASGGVLTLNYGSAHGYEALVHITVSGASVAEANGTWRVATVPAGNQLTCAIAGLPDGAVGGTLSTKVAGAGWTEPFAANSTTRVFRMGSGNMRYLRIVQAANAAAYARGYEAMTALSTGTGLFPTAAQFAGNGMIFGNPSPFNAGETWWALASQKGLYWQAINTSSNSIAGVFFGDASEPVKPADAFSTLFDPNYNQAHIARSHTGAAGAITANISPNTPSITTPSPIGAGQRFLFGVPVSADSALRGLLPGAFSAMPPAESNQAGAILSSVTGISGRVVHFYGYLNSAFIALALDEAWT